MTRKILTCCALVLLLSACSSNKTETTSTNTANPESMSTMATPAAMMESVTIVMKAQNGSGESGTATLTPMGNKTRVVIGVKGENATGKQPAHIHFGTCAKLNPAPKYALKDVILGKSNTVIETPIETLTSGGMAINVHESAANLKKYVSCGNITK